MLAELVAKKTGYNYWAGPHKIGTSAQDYGLPYLSGSTTLHNLWNYYKTFLCSMLETGYPLYIMKNETKPC